jgi:hypothetical protein
LFNPADRLLNELHHAARLGAKQRGEIAELAFMRKAATLGFAVAKPWGDSDRYDVILRSGKIFWRVQIKSAWFVSGRRSHYHIRTTGGGNSCYSAAEIDFLVAYIFPEDAWYVFPVAMIANRKRFFCFAALQAVMVRAISRCLGPDAFAGNRAGPACHGEH